MVLKMRNHEVIDGTPASLALDLQRETPSFKLLARVLDGMRTTIQDKPNHGIPQSIRFKMFSSLPVISEAVINYLQKALAKDPEGTSVYATLVHGDSLDPLYSAAEKKVDATAVQQSVMDAAMAQTPNFVPLEGGFGVHLSAPIDSLTPLQRSTLVRVLPSLEKALTETAESLVPQSSEDGASAKTDLENMVTLPRTEYEQLVRHATTDKLTGLSNRVGYGVRLDQELGGLTREKDGAVCSYVMIDIDHFKRANDSYGHLKGDEILAAVARVIESSVRERDIAARFGGEEFMIVLPATNSETAYMVAERLRQKIARDISVPVDPVDGNGTTEDAVGENAALYTPTVSIGVATGYVVERDMDKSRETIATLAKEADAALYAAKESGRNRVIVYDASMNKNPVKHSILQSVSRGEISVEAEAVLQ